MATRIELAVITAKRPGSKDRYHQIHGSWGSLGNAKAASAVIGRGRFSDAETLIIDYYRRRGDKSPVESETLTVRVNSAALSYAEHVWDLTPTHELFSPAVQAFLNGDPNDR